MSGVYYNEIDPYAAQWLRNLIAAGHIAPGDVDERSIVDVRADDLRGYRQCHFFAGIGVWSYALRLAGWPDDEQVWTGSCPCQPFSAAGSGGGFDESRHLWPNWAGLIRECGPGTVFGEQVASRDGLAWLDFVCADLEGEGYAIGAVDTCAAGFGAPHIRQRLWFVADSNTYRSQESICCSPWEKPSRRIFEDGGKSGKLADTDLGGIRQGAESECPRGPVNGFWHPADWLPCIDGKARPVEPGTFPLAHGATARVGRLRAYGNAIVAPVAAEFIRAYRSVRP